MKDIDIDKLKEIYPNTRNEDIIKIFNISANQLVKYRKKYSLSKSKEHKSRMIGLRNKMVGRNLDYSELKDIASKYKSRSELQLKDPSAYYSARVMGILDDICKHMIPQSFSIPQMILFQIVSEIFKDNNINYNDRKVIKPYEVDIYVVGKLAFEYDGKGWHQNARTNKFKLLDEMGIDLITISERNRRYEEDIKFQLCENIDILKKHLDIQIDEDKILNLEVNMDKIFSRILDMDDIKNKIKKSGKLSVFKKENASLYNKIRKLENYKELVSDIRTVVEYTDEYVNSIINKYDYLDDLIENNRNVYTYLFKNGKKHLLNNLKRKKRIIDLKMCLDFIKENKIKTKYYLRKKDSSIYIWMKKNVGLDKINDYLYK